MQRSVFEKNLIERFSLSSSSSTVSSLAVTSGGERLFVGTSDGYIQLFECRGNTKCALLDTIRKQSKDKKPITTLICVESWRVIICIADGVVTAYDSQFYQLLSTIVDNKGCHLFAVSEKTYSLVLANKKKLFLYSWQSPGFALRKEMSLGDIPKCLHCLEHSGSVIVGYKRHYELVDLTTSISTRVVDVEKEHQMFCLELPNSITRPASILLSLGTQGIVMEYAKLLSVEGISVESGALSVYSSTVLEWLAAPVSAYLVNPFIVSHLSDSLNTIEIHDLATLNSLQKISVFNTPLLYDRVSLYTCFVDAEAFKQQYVYICNGDQMATLNLVPISAQIDQVLVLFNF